MTTELDATGSDRFVRLALLAVFSILGIALAIERSHTDCFPATMSQYVNTALRPAVTACFAAMGLCLVLVRPGVRSQRCVSVLQRVLGTADRGALGYLRPEWLYTLVPTPGEARCSELYFG